MSEYYNGPTIGFGMNEIQILTADRDEWKRRALLAEEQLATLQYQVRGEHWPKGWTVD